jgi:hypothetical protein
MKRLQLFIVLLLLILISTNVSAQRWKSKRYEAYIGLGTAQHYGDIGGSISKDNAYGFKDIQLRYTRPSITLGARYKLNGRMAAKLNFGTGFIVGNDRNSKNELNRNYSFKATLFETSAQYEYYLIPEGGKSSSAAMFNHKGMVNNFFEINLYLFAGVGGVYSKSTVYNSLGKVLVRDAYSTFTGDRYPHFGACFPLGVGVKYIWNTDWSFGAEFGRRFTTSDYLDGYSSMYSSHKDVYDFFTFTAIYQVLTNRRGMPILGKKARFRR